MTAPRSWLGIFTAVRRKESDTPQVEPVFGQIKNLHGPGVLHRGYSAVNTEWKLMATAHNLLKYWRMTTAMAV